MAAPIEAKRVLLVAANFAQKTRGILEAHKYWDPDRRLRKLEDGRVAIPVYEAGVGPLEEILDVPYEITTLALPQSHKATWKSPQVKLQENIKKLWLAKMTKVWTEKMAAEIPQAWDLYGDLVLLDKASFHSAVWKAIEPELWSVVAESLNVKRVGRKSCINSDDYRTPQVELLLGLDGWVQHTDNGIKYAYDVTKCMFSSGNITEKLRVASFDCVGQTVVDLYAGIGYFTLPYLVHGGAEHLHACEWNPDAVEALTHNLSLNGVADRATVHHGDNRQVCPRGVADRVNLGLIPSSEAGWAVACTALRPHAGGLLHIHHNAASKICQSDAAQSNEEATEVDRTSPPGGASYCDITHNDTSSKICQSDAAQNNDYSKNGAITDNVNSHPKYLEERGDICDLLSAEEAVEMDRNSPPGGASDCDRTLQRDTLCRYDGDWSKVRLSWRSWTWQTCQRIQHLLQEAHGGQWKVYVLHIEHVKSYAPHIDHIVLDLDCRPLSYNET